jgi:Zn-dependent metalloprotease
MFMKTIHTLVLLIALAVSINAQSVFKSLPEAKPTTTIKPLKAPEAYLQKLRANNNIQEAVQFNSRPMLRPVSGVEVVERDKAGRPLFLKTNKDYVHNKAQTLAQQASLFLQRSSSILGIPQADQAFELKEAWEDKLGFTHLKMQQSYKGVEVYGGEVILHAKDGIIKSMNGNYLKQPKEMDISPSISKENAQESLVSNVGIKEVSDDPLHLFDFDKLMSQLVIYTDPAGKQSLAYHHTIYKSIIDRWEYFTDAHTGEEIHAHTSVCKLHHHEVKAEKSSKNPPPPDGPVSSTSIDLFGNPRSINAYEVSNEYYLLDASREMYSPSNSVMPDEPVGVIWTIDAFNTSIENDNFAYDHVKSNNVTFPNRSTAVSAHVNGGIAYDYFRTVHGRNAINGSGGNIISLINITDKDGNNLDNAFWNGQAMFYGNGNQAFRPLARALDVAGHEMTHGVVQATAALQYQGESGALNESFADVFGAMMDREDWLIGEDVVVTSVFRSGALRSLEDPHNGGTSLNDLGFQPKNVSEQYFGSENNGGVHINSGIPNHAFYLFAQEVGREKAEQVYYRALSNYLTKSSQFVDARIAVIQSAEDLYGQAEADAARNAWSAVGVGEGAGGDYETDAEINPGQDFIIYTDDANSRLILADGNGNLIQDPIATTGPISRPSVSDDGSIVVYVGRDNRIHLVTFNWQAGTFTNSIFDQQQVWRNAIVSKDGRRLAASTTDNDNLIYVYDAVLDQTVSYELYNPTFTQGVNAGDVVVSDAMEFDLSGQYILYDALNRIQGTTGEIEYWDIGVIEVWNNASNGFALGEVEKLFTGLQEGESIGNPTFSKNSDYIIAFDYVQNGEFYSLLGANIERGDVGLLFENGGLSYPSYSTKDDKILHDLSFFGGVDLGVIDVDDSKIQVVSNSQDILVGQSRWGVWFSNGQRTLVDLEEVEESVNELTLSPNPSADFIDLSLPFDRSEEVQVRIRNMQGQLQVSETFQLQRGENRHRIYLDKLISGTYVVTLSTKAGTYSKTFLKTH